ncbi:MAG: hypothetical protein ACI4FZ_10515 [Lachnospiraceae bacterium]
MRREKRQFTDYIANQYLRCCPYGRERLKRLSLETSRSTLVVILLSGGLLFLWNLYVERRISIYSIASIFLAGYIACIEVPEWRVRKVEENLYRSMLTYLSSVKHLYLSYRSIPNAIHDAAQESGEEMRLHAMLFYDILMGKDRKERVRSYVTSTGYNRHLKIFLVQAYEASEKGDTKTGHSESLFSENIEYLRMEIMQEVYRRRQKAYELSGYSFVALTPFFTMSLLRRWGNAFTSELSEFYEGAGNSIVLLCFVVTIAVYEAINRAKEVGLQKEIIFPSTERLADQRRVRILLTRVEKSAGKWVDRLRFLILKAGAHASAEGILLRMAGYAILTLLMLLIFFGNLHVGERNRLLHQADNVELLLPTASGKLRESAKKTVLTLTGKYQRELHPVKEEIQKEIHEQLYLPSKESEALLVAEVEQRIDALRKAHVRWYEVILAVLCAALAAGLPIAELVYRKNLIHSGAVEEIKQFQSVIWLERRLEGVTIPALLEDIEIFAVVFQPVIRECINSYSSGPQAALLRMKQLGRLLHESFSELADGFLAVEKVGIPEAFAEVGNNRDMLEKMSQLEADIQLERKKDSTDLLSRIPMFLAVGVYFILPFLWVAFSGVEEVFLMLEEL